ncbi:MAG: alpha/beta fold hydrolase [Oscillospiraceae bacterium]|jgi:alpha-beta hydrolase superfamily lysophospholipase|nr:alpha/beta fold hydrolase [Oscillospiraceae bacterium]
MQTETIRTETLRIETRFYSGGVPLECTLEAPDDAKAWPIAILCHGLSRQRNDGLDALAAYLASRDIASLRFDFCGCGERARDPFQQLVSSEMPADILAALSFAETVPFFDASRMGLAGISLGASLALRVGGYGDKRIRSIVSMAALADCGAGLRVLFERRGADYDGFLERLRQDARIDAATGSSQIVNRMEMFAETADESRRCVLDSLLAPGNAAYISLRSIASFIRLKPIDACPRITCPVYFMHGADDTLIDPSNAQRLYAAVASAHKRIAILPNTDHNIPLSARREKAFQEIASWFEQTLAPSTEYAQADELKLARATRGSTILGDFMKSESSAAGVSVDNS